MKFEILKAIKVTKIKQLEFEEWERKFYWLFKRK